VKWKLAVGGMEAWTGRYLRGHFVGSLPVSVGKPSLPNLSLTLTLSLKYTYP